MARHDRRSDLDDNLLEAYLFLNLNYEPGDQLYLFGFSRGAYTVRSLAGLLRKCGVLRREHVDKAPDALDLYRDRKEAADGPEAERFRVAHAIAWPKLTRPSTAPPVDLRIRYLGIWDTVGAAGYSARSAHLRRTQSALRVPRHRAVPGDRLPCSGKGAWP